MSEASFQVLPKPAVLLPPPQVEPPCPLTAPPSAAEIQAVDRAFVPEQEKIDAVAGLIGLYLSAPWLGDVIREHFRGPKEEEEEEPKKKKKQE